MNCRRSMAWSMLLMDVSEPRYAAVVNCNLLWNGGCHCLVVCGHRQLLVTGALFASLGSGMPMHCVTLMQTKSTCPAPSEACKCQPHSTLLGTKHSDTTCLLKRG